MGEFWDGRTGLLFIPISEPGSADGCPYMIVLKNKLEKKAETSEWNEKR
jgi:hypothetical protein